MERHQGGHELRGIQTRTAVLHRPDHGAQPGLCTPLRDTAGTILTRHPLQRLYRHHGEDAGTPAHGPGIPRPLLTLGGHQNRYSDGFLDYFGEEVLKP